MLILPTSLCHRIIDSVEESREAEENSPPRRRKKEEEEMGHVFAWLSGEIRDRKHLGEAVLFVRVLYSTEPPRSIRWLARLRGDLSKTSAISDLRDAVPPTVSLSQRQSPLATFRLPVRSPLRELEGYSVKQCFH